MTGIGENTLAQPVKPPLRERRACLAKLVKNRLTLTARYRPHPLQQRGHAARRGQAADRSAEASTRSPRLDFGAVTNLCDATSALTVEGDLPSSLAISLHEALRSSILWTVSRSCLVSLP